MQENKDIENIVQEIMRLVQGYAEGIRQGVISEAQGDGFNQGCADFSKKKFDLIESKLRGLMKNSFPVREPIGYTAGVQSDCKVTLFFDNTECATAWFESFTDSADSCNIISTSGEVV